MKTLILDHHGSAHERYHEICAVVNGFRSWARNDDLVDAVEQLVSESSAQSQTQEPT